MDPNIYYPHIWNKKVKMRGKAGSSQASSADKHSEEVFPAEEQMAVEKESGCIVFQKCIFVSCWGLRIDTVTKNQVGEESQSSSELVTFPRSIAAV